MFIPSWAEVANGIPGNHTDAIHVAKSEATSDVHTVANGIHMWPTPMQLVRSAIYSTHSHVFCEPQGLMAAYIRCHHRDVPILVWRSWCSST